MGKQTVSGRRYPTSGELQAWSTAEQNTFWAPVCELIETESSVKVIIDLPGISARDIQIAILPRVLIVKNKVRLAAGRTWREVARAILGPLELFRRFEMPSLIDVNRVTAELDMGVLTLTAPKQVAEQRPVNRVTHQAHAFAA